MPFTYRALVWLVVLAGGCQFTGVVGRERVDGAVVGCADSTPSRCTNGCVDLTRDARNCGACNAACAAGASCRGGVCVAPTDAGAACVPATERCNGVDDDCDRLVDEGDVCGFADSGTNPCGSGQLCNGVCVSLLSDSRNCGACGRTCGLTYRCLDGRCHSSLTDRYCAGTNVPEICNRFDDDCDGMLDQGIDCPSEDAGTIVCPAGSTPCTGACAILASDPANCGVCGRTCPSGYGCAEGLCHSSATGQICLGSNVVEVCDMIDDDCDGQVDEELTCP